MNPKDTLEALTPERAAYWSKAGKWTMAEAVALMQGFEPLAGWEENHQHKAYVMQIETAPLAGEIRRQSADPLPDTMTPREWIERGIKAGYVHPLILQHTDGSNRPTQKAGTSEIQAFVDDQYEDVWQSQHAAFMRGQRSAPTQASVAEELANRINRILGAGIKPDSVRRTYMEGKKPPKPD